MWEYLCNCPKKSAEIKIYIIYIEGKEGKKTSSDSLVRGRLTTCAVPPIRPPLAAAADDDEGKRQRQQSSNNCNKEPEQKQTNIFIHWYATRGAANMKVKSIVKAATLHTHAVHTHTHTHTHTHANAVRRMNRNR